MTGGKIQLDANEYNQTSCGPSIELIYNNDCCTSKSGCLNALLSGLADFFFVTIFPDSPTLGEYITERVSGMGFCQLSRNLNSHFTLDKAFDACPTAKGQVNNLGSAYAQVWWQARKANNANLVDFDKLFLRHLTQLETSDNFFSLLDKALQLDTKEFQSHFSNALKQATQDHGF